MDNYSGNLGEHEPPHLDWRGGDDRLGEDEIGREPPPAGVGQDERRMQVRAYNFWSSLLGRRHFPQITDLTSSELPDFADHAVLLDFSQGIANPAVTMLGEKLAAECGATRTIEWLSDVPGRSLLSRITDHYLQILANQAPIGFEAEFVNQRGKTLLYRGILLPFSNDGEQIRHILGVINWKELADPAMTAELVLELDSVVAADNFPVSVPLAEWADGPLTVASSDPDDMPSTDWTLADWLASARELAEVVCDLHDRGRATLYVAIGRAWDFALAAQAEPGAFSDILAAAGLTVRTRAPMTPVVKLVFGAAYDKTRLAEFATALSHARRLGVPRGGLAAFLAETPGGLKAVVGKERKLRRAATGRRDAGQAGQDKLAAKLRELPALALSEISTLGSEFAVVLLRRSADGGTCLLGEVGRDGGLIGRAVRQLLR